MKVPAFLKRSLKDPVGKEKTIVEDVAFQVLVQLILWYTGIPGGNGNTVDTDQCSGGVRHSIKLGK